MEISDLCCKDSIWEGNSEKFVQSREDYQNNSFGEGAIVQAIRGKYKNKSGMFVYLSGMGDCCISDLREEASKINGSNWREEGKKLKLVSESPMTKSQYERLKEKEFYDVEINKHFGDLNLRRLYLFGNPEQEENIEGNLFYDLKSGRNMVSWFSGKSFQGGRFEERFVQPLNPSNGKLLTKFHNSIYIDQFIKESIIEGIIKKECELRTLPF